VKAGLSRTQVTKVLLLIYVIILSWIILFKMALSVEDLPRLRNINLIPFGDSAIVNGAIDRSEIISNVIAFIPLGVYISMLRSGRSFLNKLSPIVGLSLGYEILQYVFSLGASDITGLIMNTAGGAIGILFFSILSKVVKRRSNLVMMINGLASVCTGLLVVLMGVLIAVN